MALPIFFYAEIRCLTDFTLTEGNLKFQDITEAAGLYFEGTWTTGVSLADVNGDGWMDIYLCKSGPPGGDRRHNELYINNGNLTFTERSKEYGLNFEGLSVHAAFFDYDRDGDLDCYLLNNSIRSVGQYDLRKDQRKIPDPAGGNKLLRNDGNRFTDVTLQAGIYSSQIGFGLGVAVSDINLDGWPDLYVANDFFEKDYLYLNQRNGTFREQLEDMMTEISLGSMGADIADINNDGLPEIFVTEMLPETDYRLKTTSQFENWTKYSENVKNGYFRQFSRNVLQLNNGNGTFSEIGRYAGVQATDWSWGALMFDMDNDGWKDIFVANGIYKDLLNQDYANFVANPVFIRSQIKKGAAVITQLIDTIPSNKISNYFFRNNGNLTFSNMSGFWVADAPGFSNGSAYADLDNDGDLDLVINNVNMPAMVLENNATRYEPASNYFALQLIQSDKNRFAVGSKVWIWAGGRSFYQELFPARGFMSSVDYRLFFGLGHASAIDSMVIQWPDGKHTLHKNLRANAFLTVAKENSQQTNPVQKTENPAWFVRLNPSGIQFSHTENEYDDFNFDRLLFIMTSNEGPCLCKGDVNADGLDDFYIGGATGQPGKLYVQTTDGKFKSLAESIFEADRQSEDVSCVFFDANGDGRDDLYVASGGREFSSSSFALVDRLYFSNTGSVTKSTQVLPHGSRFSLSSTVTVADFNHDGFPDLFVGARHRPQAYGVVSESYLLLNDGKGHLTDVTADWLPALKLAGMITAAAWADVNADGRPDLVLAGEWMPIRLFINRDSGFVDETLAWGLGQSNGWYHALEITDVNNDGRSDLVVGNHGLNSMFRASASAPLMMWVNDFDNNGTTEQIIARNLDGKYYPYVLLPEFLAQMPVFKKKFLYYNSYAGQPVENIFGSEMLTTSIRYEAFDFASSVWLNRGNRFEKVELPQPAQFMPVYAIHSHDVNHDGNTDLILGGNQSRAKPQTGAYMAGYGVVLSGNGDGTFRPLSQAESGISLRGDVRNIATIKIRREPVTLFALSDGPLYFFKSKFKNQ
ncbi:MAG: hypothetical protein KatS3mg032_0277 [Cyclobacteriaceae bacterium]|nr:MAG: hypothetical protein KatS3mg032_0277 [Cyclobacteriaceae bacterium]